MGRWFWVVDRFVGYAEGVWILHNGSS
ncbi:hypothetical protein ACMD2_05203 [Ananas comosus]|uniref:Uncharacterized protein n=1 Tax=Ananas comosus TaxID=4615 RepID=A0A199USI9_ANACO|nr:hypothetical protein ACMD2_05203 [Ananas comosus]